ncbi:MAG: ATP-dependent DNA ligase [Nitrospira sp.]|nr:ATP-dependent DNA ligase [Nitrospira sp.]
MQAFAALFERIDQTTSTNEKVESMADFFLRQDAETSAWTVFFLSGRKPKQLVGSAKLRRWAQELLGLPDWLVTECYGAVGDTAEMVALMIAATGHARQSSEALSALSLGEWMSTRLLPLAAMDDTSRHRRIVDWWLELSPKEIFILNKLLTGSLRVGVSETLVYRALASVLSLSPSVVASRLMSDWHPSAEFFLRLGQPFHEDQSAAHADNALLPVPFCLAAPLERDPAELGSVDEWQCEWKWDGIRCQAVKRATQLEIWSRGEERITSSFPDLVEKFSKVPGDWILDGEIVAGEWRSPQSFHMLQRRINRKKPTEASIKATPVAFLAYDLLQWNGKSWRESLLAERRTALENLLGSAVGSHLGISPLLSIASWDEAARLREQSRNSGAEGLILKSKRSVYETGRRRGVWFKWKIDPLSIDAVLTSAQPGTGRRASLYTDYTFSLWSIDELVPVAKAYSGLTDMEVRELDRWIRKHTIERFGPVRKVEAVRVFEIGFEGISRSERHKSGYAVRFPRILRERTDKQAQDANAVEDLEQLSKSVGMQSALSDASIKAPRSDNRSLQGEQMRLHLGDETDSA